MSLLVGGTAVTATVLASAATAACIPSGATTRGSSTVTGLRIGGITVTVTGAPNQGVISGLVRLVLNAQIVSSGNIVVRALHASVLAPLQAADVIISEVDANVACSCQSETLDAGVDSATVQDASALPNGDTHSDAAGGNDSGRLGASGPPIVPEDSGTRPDGPADADAGTGDAGEGSDGAVAYDAGSGSDGAATSDSGADSGGSHDSGGGSEGGDASDSGAPHSTIDGSTGKDSATPEPKPPTDSAVPPMTCDNDDRCPSSYTCVTPVPLQ